ncbi:EamA family transporter RarD [Nocardioides sp. SOB77]|uniref:EamA family transporter RarD n=1 Tax=Nocardioides oceani TaxID=3058369 RepID=A0ABT8FC30_9ACTN|nr:EamA family transporter RarD [Nocardioides oceani]MDN4171717.1 EamA family transporter RarD [Nocardioides oceani]
MSNARRGLLLGLAAYTVWGGFPLYFPLLEPAGAVEVLAHRILWSAVTMGVLVLVLGRVPHVRDLLRSPRTMLLLTVAALSVTVNWGTYIWGVTNDRVVEASLGYFVNPLVTVLLGVFVLGERLRPAQWGAVGVAAAAVAVLTVDYGHPPYVALVLALSFAAYGLAKKTADVGAVESLAVETAVVAPLALAYVAVLVATGASGFGQHGTGHALLLMSSGIVTAVPLIAFGAAATRVPLVTLGLMQYLTPVIQFALGVTVFDEAMPPARWAGFALVWLALVIFTVEANNHRRRQLRLLATTSTAA